MLPSQGEKPESSGRDWDTRGRGREGEDQGNSLGRHDMEARGAGDDVGDCADIIFI